MWHNVSPEQYSLSFVHIFLKAIIMFKKIAVAAALAIAASTAAAAAPSYYFGVDAGSTKLDGYDNRETSIGLFAGYNITPMFAVEGTYRRLADVVTNDFGPTANIKLDQIGISGIAGMPVGAGFRAYGRLGYNNINVKAKVGTGAGDADESGVLYGLGLSYTLTQYVSARVEVQKPTSDTTNVSFGIAATF